MTTTVSIEDQIKEVLEQSEPSYAISLLHTLGITHKSDSETVARAILTLFSNWNNFEANDPILDTLLVRRAVQAFRALEQPQLLSDFASIEAARHTEFREIMGEEFLEGKSTHEDYIIAALVQMDNQAAAKALGSHLADLYPEKTVAALQYMNAANIPGVLTGITKFSFRDGGPEEQKKRIKKATLGLEAIKHMHERLQGKNKPEFSKKSVKDAADRMTKALLSPHLLSILAGESIYSHEQLFIYDPHKKGPVDSKTVSRLQSAFRKTYEIHGDFERTQDFGMITDAHKETMKIQDRVKNRLDALENN